MPFEHSLIKKTCFIAVKEEVDKGDGVSDITGAGSDDQSEKVPNDVSDNIKLEPDEIKKEVNSPNSVLPPSTVPSA